MPTDLYTASLIVRNGLVLDERSLVILEPEVSKSRIWRVPYEQVQRLTVSRQLPFGRMTVVSIFIILPGILLAAFSPEGLWILGAILIAIGLCIVIFYAVCGKTTFELEYGQRKRSFSVIARPQKVSRFITRFAHAVEAAQDHFRQEYAGSEGGPGSSVTSTS